MELDLGGTGKEYAVESFYSLLISTISKSQI